MKEGLWEAVCEANAPYACNVSLRRFGAGWLAGLPVLGPPTVQSRNQLIREDHLYKIAAGFVECFRLD